MADYEALGRYTEAKERLTKLLNERKQLVTRLEKQASLVNLSSSGYPIIIFDVEKAKELLSQIEKYETDLQVLITEINTNADKCEKPRVTTRNVEI